MASDPPPPPPPLGPDSAAPASDGGKAVPGPIAETLNEPLGASTGRAAPEVFEHDSKGSVRCGSGEGDVVGKDGKAGALSAAAARDPAGAEAKLGETHANGLTDQTNYLPVKQVLICFASLQLCVVLSFLDQTIVSTALPSISASFDAGRSSSWIASAYLLTSTAFQPIWGRLSDIWGRKVAVLACVVLFIIGSLACAVAQTMTQLIVFRGLQGAGGGGLLTLVLIIVSDLVSLKERGKYQGITEATIAVSNGIGPLLGGVISDTTTWRWFWLNLPVGALGLAVIFFFLPLKRVTGDYKSKLKQIDYLGCLLTLGGCSMIVLPLNWGGTSFAWTSPQVLGCLIGGFATFVVFFLWEGSRWAKIPVVPPRIFKDRTVITVMQCTFLSGMTVLGQSYYIPQFIQICRGSSAITSGALILPLLLFTTLFVFATGQLISRWGKYKPSICVGYALWCIALGLLSTIDQNVSTGKLVGILLFAGVGQGQTLQSSMVAAQASVPRSDMSAVTSSRNFLRTLGGAFSLAIAAAVINNQLRSKLSPLGFSSSVIDEIIDDPVGIWTSTSDLYAIDEASKQEIIRSYVSGFRIVFLIFTGLIAFNAVTSTLFLAQNSLERADEAALKARGAEWHAQQKARRKAAGGGSGTATPAEADLEKGEGGVGVAGAGAERSRRESEATVVGEKEGVKA